MLKVLYALILGVTIVLINIYYYGLQKTIIYSQVIPNIIAFIAILAGFYLSDKLKNLPSVYNNVNLGFVFIIISHANLIAFFITNQPLQVLSVTEFFVKLPGIALVLIGMKNWLKIKEEREHKLKEQEEKWKGIVEGIKDIIVIIQDNKVKYINPNVKDILGVKPEDIIGKNLSNLIHREDIEKLLSNKKTPQKIKLKSKNGQIKVFEVNPSYITYEGKPAVLGILRDITDKVQKEQELLKTKEALEEIREKLHAAQKAAKVGYWEIHLPDLNVKLSEEAMAIFEETEKADSIPFEQFLEYVNPKEKNEIKEKRLTAITSLVPYEAEYRIYTGKREKIIREKVQILKESSSNPIILGIVQDITDIYTIYQKVLENEERYRSLFEYSNDAIVIADIDGNIKDVNQKAVYKLGYSKLDLTILNLKDIFEERFKKVFKEWLKRLYVNGHLRFETEVITKDKSTFSAEVSASIVEIKGKKYIQLIIRDITDRKLAEKELKLASMVFENALEGIVITDENGIILRSNEAFTEITGFDKSEILGWKINQIPVFSLRGNHFLRVWHKAETSDRWQGEITGLKKNGDTFPAWLSIIKVKNRGETTNFIVMISDITRRKHKEKKLKNLAYYDNLTKLPNRPHFFNKLKSAVERATENKTKFALFFIDLDGFKQVNDTYGHEVGDKLLIEVAKKLRSSVRKDDFVARLAGDEFVILIENIDGKEVLKKIADKIIKNVGSIYIIDGNEIKIGASIGISIFPDDANDIETIMRHADSAMYHSKLTGKNRSTFYADIINKR
ncbi:PAS domain S-box-containing protein/diguanylate cyclase (GGDEF) domain-containing protein [Persephonella hydrogeniphila]|uniref:PAS domain S-box-containing protein/diguanylate cyclase (GGDEF) domain-containing protein n=1 Tax=Persephonella hydrogeniphila TaxID=198703 RepID=A0A285N1Q3_9AQUI|nr:PAS domain S-box protein [Persephonella hydrogeniphila]SNZ03405.1 PAS domain S-box-containing protein/diguanylate cyclase (GGDEF) domain-containing protein [Persephonella hydrogeniphila]